MTSQKNKYGVDLLSIKKTVFSKHPEEIANIPEYGKVYAYCHALEKWNHHKQDPATGEWHIPSGPPWDVNGHQCEDIYVRVYLNPFSFKFYPQYLNKIKKWIQTSYEESFDKKFNLKNIFNFLSWLWFMRSCLYLYDEYWTFVIDSFQSMKHDIAEEILSEKLGGDSEALKLLRKNHKLYNSKYEEIYNNLSNDFIENYLNKDYWRINVYMWVQKSDPTCFIIDESTKKFDLPNGWSEKQILNHLKRWYYLVADKRVEIKDIKPEKE